MPAIQQPVLANHILIWISQFLQSSSNRNFCFHPSVVKNNCCLNHFFQVLPFYTPWRHQKTFSFLIFEGGIKQGAVEKSRWSYTAAYSQEINVLFIACGDVFRTLNLWWNFLQKYLITSQWVFGRNLNT